MAGELRRVGWFPALLIVGAGLVAAFLSLQAVGRDSAPAPRPVAATVPVKDAQPRAAVRPAPRQRHTPQVVEPPAGGSAVAENQLPPETASAPAPATASGRRRANPPSLRKAVGRKIMTGFNGTFPSQSLLGRVRRGEVGGVILFAGNVSGNLAAAIAALQSAARAGGNAPLVIATDQEGGEVRRLPAAPPSMAPAAMTSATAATQGAATGQALRQLGISVDLAPVADVDHGSFLKTRSFGSTPSRVAASACAFARGLQSQGVAGTLKHFPGLGRTLQNTDLRPVSVNASSSAILADLAPYDACAREARLIMISNAAYPTLGATGPAVFSTSIINGLLRGQLRFRGVTISDTLSAPGIASPTTAVRASRAGVDMLLYTDERVSARAYLNVLRAARSGVLSRSSVFASAKRIRALTT